MRLSQTDPRATVLCIDGVGGFRFDDATGNDEHRPDDARWRHTPSFRHAVLGEKTVWANPMFSHPCLAISVFAQTNLGQPNLANCVCVCHGGAPKGGAPKGERGVKVGGE